MQDNIEVNIVEMKKDAFLTEMKTKDNNNDELAINKILMQGDYSCV
jgi:hypothetical protein